MCAVFDWGAARGEPLFVRAAVVGIDQRADEGIEIDGSTLLERVVRALQEAGISRIGVSCDEGPVAELAHRLGAQVIEGAGKKMHLFHEMREGDRLVATAEHMLLHVDLKTRRSAPPAAEIEVALAKVAQAHQGLAKPEGLGRAIGAER